MQDGLVKKDDQDVGFQEFNEKKVQFPMNLLMMEQKNWEYLRMHCELIDL